MVRRVRRVEFGAWIRIDSRKFSDVDESSSLKPTAPLAPLLPKTVPLGRWPRLIPRIGGNDALAISLRS
jgi:hypothetical protein